jgi:hypothetical protein
MQVVALLPVVLPVVLVSPLLQLFPYPYHPPLQQPLLLPRLRVLHLLSQDQLQGLQIKSNIGRPLSSSEVPMLASQPLRFVTQC